MRVECIATFLHGTDRFEAGDVRTVPDELGAYFVAQGWAKLEGNAATAPAQGDVTLDIHDSHQGSEASNG